MLLRRIKSDKHSKICNSLNLYFIMLWCSKCVYDLSLKNVSNIKVFCITSVTLWIINGRINVTMERLWVEFGQWSTWNRSPTRAGAPVARLSHRSFRPRPEHLSRFARLSMDGSIGYSNGPFIYSHVRAFREVSPGNDESKIYYLRLFGNFKWLQTFDY